MDNSGSMLAVGPTVAGGTLAMTVLWGCWSYVRLWWNKLIGLLLVTVTLEREAGEAVSAYLWSRTRKTSAGQRRYASICQPVRPLRKMQHIGFEKFGTDLQIFWLGWRPLFVRRPPNSGYNNQPIDELLLVSFVRGTIDPDQLLLDGLDVFNEHDQTTGSRFSVCRFTGRMVSYDRPGQLRAVEPPEVKPAMFKSKQLRLLRWSADDLGTFADGQGRALDALLFPEEVQQYIQEVRHWKESEAWYLQRSIPWRRGWLLYGKPGTGKTALTRALGQDLDLPVYVFDLPTLSNREMVEYWRTMQSNTPCIALLEDLDAVFKGRDNLSKKEDGLTFDCLLNCLSGIETANGVFLVVTTNHPESLDPAIGVPDPSKGTISSRPGRIDRAIELKEIDQDGRLQMARRILMDCPARIPELVIAGHGDTPAQFQERCAMVALEEYWSATSAVKIAI